MTDVLTLFALPQATELSQKIAKKHFYDDATVSKAMGARLQEEIEGIWLVRQMTPDNSQLAAVMNDAVEYGEVLFLQIQLKETISPNVSLIPLLEAIHKALPYPLVLVVSASWGQLLSLAEKRINQSDKDSDKLVLQEQHCTPWLTENLTALTDFYASLNFSSIAATELLSYYQGIIERIVQLNLSIKTGQNQFVNAAPVGRETLKQIEALEQEIDKLRQQLGKTVEFNAKVALNMQIKRLNQQLQAVMK